MLPLYIIALVVRVFVQSSHESILRKNRFGLIFACSLADIPNWILPKWRPRVGRGKTALKPLPWQVRLRIDGIDWCGGTIVDHKTVITAAHCVDNRPDGEGVTIHAGATNVEEFPQVS